MWKNTAFAIWTNTFLKTWTNTILTKNYKIVEPAN